MAYSTPRTWVAGEYPTAAQLNANIKENVSFLANPPSCRATQTGVQVIAHNTATAVVLTTADDWDTAAMHSTSATPSRIIVPVAGVYVVSANARWGSSASTATRLMRITCNGITIAEELADNRTGVIGQALTTQWKANATNYFEIVVYQFTGGELNIDGAGAPVSLAVTWVGLG